MSILGMSSFSLFDYYQAMHWFRKCLDAQLSLLGMDHPSTVYTRDYLALICFYRGQLVEVRVLYEAITSTYCTANKVPVDEQAAFASYEPIATRTWHPKLYLSV
ncbi:hypothetical protein SDRG_13086 [Saprolegnia diclina VS20]|uniref:Uncharacterized protein n=1 Tax=Saprolegnia diclina (strain VS20) TaxID=1156394 RepID=T0RAK2_SAPDV|nr:hypothetical protein SDRG_13086 [Saprolegnia diclina VS20]EQC29213.1 hypothetical protein SDRG_13086 [Saprolegnia diclina VS20]|eukprot:XP_008617391.1 hypothetical protein SDRG_13086 [Saprolegnia diclina VS20]